MTVPGGPDGYQGCELWDFSLVDRAELLAALAKAGKPSPQAADVLLETWPDGRIKLFVVSRLLGFCRFNAALFTEDSYVAAYTSGSRADHVCAFSGGWAKARSSSPSHASSRRRVGAKPRQPLGDACWSDTRIEWQGAATRYRNLLTGETLESEAADGRQGAPAARLFACLPVAALVAG